MDKLLLHFRARQHKEAALAERLPGLADELFARLASAQPRLTVLIAREEDPMRGTGDSQPAQAFDATLELRTDSAGGVANSGNELEERPCIDGLKELGSSLDEWIQRDLCAAQLGTNRAFIPCAPVPLRFQYCMRRRHDFSQQAYLERYAEIHSQFGFKTQGIAGYSQFHIDLEASGRACEAAGFGISQVSSVSELHMESMEAFFEKFPENREIGAGEDEDLFVDRRSSLMWISDEVFRLGWN